MSKLFFNTVLVIVGCIVLFFIAQNLINEKKVPSLEDFMASSTAMIASTTSNFLTDIASSTVNIASSTTNISTSTLSPTPLTLVGLPTTTIFTSKGSLKVFIADTDATQQQGLSDVPSLPDGVGMLFVFNNPGQYSFWMKDMNFPLDMVWIDSNKIVRDISMDALPSSYPSAFTPVSPISYVIEMNADTSEKFGLTKGSLVRFTLP